MKKKLAFIAVSLAAGLAAIAWVFLAGGPQGPAAPAERESPPAASDSAAGPRPAAAGQKSAGGPAASAAEAEMVMRNTETTGDMTMSYLRGGGELGYVDVDSIINNNDPYSIVALLQAHRDLTGADESLEIVILYTLDYPASKDVVFDQLIGGKRSADGRGSVSFDPATGAVKSIMASLVIPDPALAASVVILQDEAVTIARAFVTSAVLEEKTVAIESDSGRVGVRPRLRPGFALDIYSVTPKELRYALDPETNKTRAEWPVWISADLGDFTPGFSWEVLVDASTGEIAGIRSLWRRAAGNCSDLTYRVFDGKSMTSLQQFPRTLLPDTDPWPATVIGYAKGMTADIIAANPSYIGEARRSDCEVDIVINVPDDVLMTLEGPAAGIYQEERDRILV